jgi:hypothetical protein
VLWLGDVLPSSDWRAAGSGGQSYSQVCVSVFVPEFASVYKRRPCVLITYWSGLLSASYSLCSTLSQSLRQSFLSCVILMFRGGT